MPIHKLKLLNRYPVATHTLVLEFEKPAGFTYLPGQYGGFTLINPSTTDAGVMTRRFSLLSAPDEKTLRIATRIQQSTFKQELSQMPLGSEIKFAGPTGTFTLHTDAAIPAVFIAGGIGIAPFYSMIKHALVHKPHQELILFYGNQEKADAAFLSDLIELQTTHPQFKCIATLAKPDANWQGENGFITESMINKHVKNLQLPIYYVCGSPAMVTTLQEILVEMGIDEEKIKIEDFPGY